MFIPMLFVEDRSYFTDELEKLTGKPRRYWSEWPLVMLQERLFQERRRSLLRWKDATRWSPGRLKSRKTHLSSRPHHYVRDGGTGD